MSETAGQPKFGTTDLLLLTMAAIWAVNFSVVKYAMQIFSPLAFTGLRVGVAAAVLGAMALVSERTSLTRRDVLLLLGLGVLGNGLYQLLFVSGMARTRAGNAALIVAAAPGFIALASRFRGLEKLGRMTIAGVALSVVGVAVVMLGSARGTAGSSTFLGSFLVFCGVICWTFFTVLLQPHTTRIKVVQLSAITMAGGAIPLLIVSAPALLATRWSAVGWEGWAALFYASVISMVVAYMFWYRGLRVLGPTRTAVYSNVQPIIALLVAWLFLSEAPTAWQWGGAATIIAGVFLTRT